MDKFRSKFSTKDFGSSVRNDLVRVHVRLSTRSSLPNDKWEMIVEFTFAYFLGGLDNSFSFLFIEAIVQIGSSCSLLQNTKRSNNWNWHSFSFSTNFKVHQTSLSLSSPVSIGWNLKWSKGITFGSESSCESSQLAIER